MKKNLILSAFVLGMLMILPMVSAVWWNPFTWFDNNPDISKVSGEWYLDHMDGIRLEYFDYSLDNLANGKAKICLIPKDPMSVNDPIIQQSRATLRQNKIITGEVEPSDMELERSAGKVIKMCIDVDSATENYARFGSNSALFLYTSEKIIAIEDGIEIGSLSVGGTEWEYKIGKPHVHVGSGNNILTHQFYIENYKENAITNLRGIDMYTKNEVNRDLIVKYKSNENILINDSYESCNIENICEDVVNGTKWVYKEVWKNIETAIEGENYILGIFANVTDDDYIDIDFDYYGTSVLDSPINWGTFDASTLYETYDADANHFVTKGSAIGQSFTIGSVGDNVDVYVDGVSIELERVGTIGTYQLKIEGTATGSQPNGTVYYSGSFDASSISNAGEEWIDVVMDDIGGVPLQPSEQYYLVLYIGSGTDDASNYLKWELDNTIGYAGGYGSSGATNGTGSWSSVGGGAYDASFKLYGNANQDNSPIISLESPSSGNYTSIQNPTINFSVTDDFQITQVDMYVNGVLNQSNSSGATNQTYLFNLNLGEGDFLIWGNATDNNSITTGSSVIRIVIDTTSPLIENISSNETELLFGYPQNILIENVENDIHLSNCWYNLNYNLTNTSFNCNTNITLLNVPEGNNQITIFANDSFGLENYSSYNFTIDYYTHRIGYVNNITNNYFSPSCSFNSNDYTGNIQNYSIIGTAERFVNCSSPGYGTFNHTLTENNQTSYNVSVNPANLNFNWDTSTDVRVAWVGGANTYSGVSSIFLDLQSIPIGYVHIAFNNETQNFAFYHDNVTSVSRDFHVETVDLDQVIKVVSNNEELSGAFVEFKKSDNSTLRTTYSTFTDINGLAHVLVDDGTSYEVEVTKEGFEDYNDLVYVPTSNTETIIINLISEDGSTGDYYFASSCLASVGIATNCTWYVKSYKTSNITFNYTWNGVNYSVTSQNSEANLTLIVNETTAPVNVTASVNPTKFYGVSWKGLASRSIQLEFDTDEIKDETNGVLVLFYSIVLILGILMAVVINRIPKMKGKGLGVMMIWFGINAFQFPLLWFIVIPVVVYYIFKTFWGNEE